jgi:DMSO/TMAO reductase YedYZ molybdopterin-dependent catalytic subunit
MLRRVASVLLTLTVLCPLPVRAQDAQRPASPASPAALTIAGDVATPLTLSLADLKAMPRTRVEHIDHDVKRVHEGVLVSAILERAGVPVGTGLRGEALVTVVVAQATDGYGVAFSLGELDAALARQDIIVADTTDGAALAEPQGPLRLVVPKDSRGARSVRMLVRLEVVRLPRTAR